MIVHGKQLFEAHSLDVADQLFNDWIDHLFGGKLPDSRATAVLSTSGNWIATWYQGDDSAPVEAEIRTATEREIAVHEAYRTIMKEITSRRP